MRIVVTGSAGFVGRRITKHLQKQEHQIVAAYHRNDPSFDSITTRRLDITDADRVKKLLKDVAPDAVVHAAALADADTCEQHPDQAWETNVQGTKNVIQGAEEIESHVLFISSSFVFSGSAKHYSETDILDPINVYGETKAAAEKKVERSTVQSTIVRIDQPYGKSTDWQSPSMVEWILDELESESGAVEVFSDWSNNPILNKDIADYVRLLIENDCQGTYHIVGPEHISRYHWAKRIAAVFGYDVNRIRSIKSINAGLPAKRPNANLSISKIVSHTGYAPSGIYDGLQELRENNRLYLQIGRNSKTNE